MSHYITAQRIAKVFTKRGHKCKLHDYQDRTANEKRILFIGTVFAANLSYLTRFLPGQKVVFYGTVEGFPIMDPKGIEKKIAESVPIVAVSRFVKMCLETVGIPVEDVVYHGIDMKQTAYDKEYYQYLKDFIKGPVVLYIAGNSERKGIDRFIVACKLVARSNPEAWFILHSGPGYVNIPKIIEDLEVPNFWYTNAFGMMAWPKMNSLYKLCTVNTLASYTEGYGLTQIEGFRFNKPVVAVDVEPYNEIVENGKTGILIPCKKVVQRRYMDRFLFPLHTYSVDAMADSVITILNDKKLRAEMAGHISREKQRFRSEETYPKILEYF